MKIAVVAHGSRGDVQPPMALACRLVEAGHEVTIAVPSDFADAAARLGCRAVSLPTAVRKDLDAEAVAAPLRRGATMTTFRNALAIELGRAGPLQDAVVDATEGAELIVASALVEDICLSAAEARRQRVTFAFPSPFWPNASYPSLMFAAWPVPRVLNHLTYGVLEVGALQLLPLINRTRVRLGLRVVRRRPASAFRRQAPPVFYWVPPEVVPPPADYGAHHVFTGYWSPPPALRAALGERDPDAALVRFVAAGPPPIYVGFGSMPVLDERTVEIIGRVADALELRVVLGVGWSRQVPRSSDRVLVVGDVDHDWLLPRCAAAVHHGGASTTSAAIRAGVPAVVASVFADQPFWGRRVVALGVGDAFRFQQLSVSRLRRGLERALSPATEARARMLAAELARVPDGARTTARLIGRWASRFAIPETL